MGSACASSIQAIEKLKQNLGLPDRFLEEEPQRISTDFNVNSYLSVLRHISIEPGYVLDFVYFSDELGGKPLVYARPTSQLPFSTYSEFIASVGVPSYEERSYMYLEHAHDFMQYIKSDDTEAGYLELIELATLMDQFYLFWHGLYNDAIFFCGEGDFGKVDEALSRFDLELPDDVRLAAQGIDFVPVVSIGDDSALIRYVYFTKWGGFVEVWYEVSRGYPHQVLDGGDRLLVEYDCGISF